MPHGPLTGMKMIECTTWGFGPIGGMMLGDLGADIIKIESADRPDAARYITNIVGIDNLMPDGQSASFQSFNRNKRSLGMDLKSERGKAIFKEMIKETDILLESYRPGTLDKLGLGYEVLSQINPRLICCATGGYGFKGEEWSKPALDAVGQARSGFMWSMGAPGDAPNWNTQAVADVMGSMCVAYGILAAVVERERNGGQGQKVEVSHINSNMWLSFWGISVCLLKGYDDWPRFDRKHAGNPIWNLYECGDGEWVMLGIVDSTRDWPKFCEVMDLTELRDDPRFDTMENRQQHCVELIQLLDAHFAQAPRAEWEARLDRNADLIYSRVQRIKDLPTDPAVVANGYLIDYHHRLYGPIKTLNHPAHLSRTPATIRRDAPDLGEHTAEVLKERLGYTDEQIAELVVEGVIT